MLWIVWVACTGTTTPPVDDTDETDDTDVVDTEPPPGCPGTFGPPFPDSARPRHIDRFVVPLRPADPVGFGLTYPAVSGSACVEIATEEETRYGVDRSWLTEGMPLGDLCDGSTCFEFALGVQEVTLVRFTPPPGADVAVTYSRGD